MEPAEERLPTPEELAARERWFGQYVDALETRSVLAGPEGAPYRCPCCHYLTLPERGGYDVCQVCYWEDDGQDDPWADDVRGGPNGDLSLTHARTNFANFGACRPEFRESVRPPRPDEL